MIPQSAEYHRLDRSSLWLAASVVISLVNAVGWMGNSVNDYSSYRDRAELRKIDEMSKIDRKTLHGQVQDLERRLRVIEGASIP